MTSPWWAVDLGTSGVAIQKVVVVNRGDACCGKELFCSFSYMDCLDSGVWGGRFDVTFNHEICDEFLLRH